ncbi:hypothetical protein ABEX78_32245 [Priestia megaterium]
MTERDFNDLDRELESLWYETVGYQQLNSTEIFIENAIPLVQVYFIHSNKEQARKVVRDWLKYSHWIEQ